MSRKKKKKLNQADQRSREAEILKAPADTSNEAVKALMSPEFEKMSNLDASEVALILQQVIRGEMSLIAQQNEVQIARIRERQDQIDHEIAARLEANQKFIEEVLDRAEKMQRTGEEKDKLIANGVATYQAAKQIAAANRAADNIAFRKKLANEKKVTIVSPGQLVTTMEHGAQVAKIIPEEVHIKDVHMRIPVGVAVEVPETIANLLAQRKLSQEETAKRHELLSKNLESTKLAQEWAKIEGSKTDAMPM